MPFIFPIFSFASFVLWLLAIVMDGPLLVAFGIPEATTFFLPPHIISLGLLGLFCPARLFKRLSPIFCVITVLLTIAIPLAGISAGPCLLIMIGVSGAFITITASISLRQSTAPLISAVCGLAAANLLVIPFIAWPDGGFWKFALVASFLLSIPLIAWRLPETGTGAETANRWHYLPFILIFQIVSGLMYSFIMPAYQPAAYMPGAELPFYILAVPAALWIVRKNFDLALVSGVVLGMAAFALLQNQDTPLTINMSMFAMQAGAGFIDVALLALLLGFSKPIRAFGIGLATVCLGILIGKIITTSFANMAEPVVLTGHLVLNLSILTLYFLGRFHYGQPAPAPESVPLAQPLPDMPLEEGLPDTRVELSETVESTPPCNSVEGAPRMPGNIRLLLSDREYLVLAGTLAGKSFRETAAELAISESTVKTYMRRIYEKMEVKGKKELFEMLSHL